jgi:hypothetical protein
MRRRSLAIAGLTTALALFTTVLSIAPQASGVSYTSIIRASAPLDWCPGNASICQDSRRVSTLATGTRVHMNCWIDARKNGFTYPRWFYVTVSNGKTGFVKAERVGRQTSVANCSTNLAVMASLWTTGLDHYNKKTPTAADLANMKKYFGKPADKSSNGWGPMLDWNGECISFAALAWLSTGATHRIYFANAIDSYYKYRSRGLVHTSGTPPRGALVYWHSYSGGKDYGHVAVSLGNGRVVTTGGYDAQNVRQMQAITDKAIWAGSVGWVMPF